MIYDHLRGHNYVTQVRKRGGREKTGRIGNSNEDGRMKKENKQINKSYCVQLIFGRERERERKRLGGDRERACVSVCACVGVGERERGGEGGDVEREGSWLRERVENEEKILY